MWKSLIIKKFFPDEAEVLQKDPKVDLRGGGRIELAKTITKKLLKDKALKIALLSLFATAEIQSFQSEIEALLVDDVFKYLLVN